MSQHEFSRRLFLQQGTGVAGAAWLNVVVPSMAAIAQAACTAKEEGQPFTILDDDEAAEFGAIAERIIPTTDTPGAREAGVIYFFDQSFGTFNAPLLPMLRGGLSELQAGIEGGRKFSELAAPAQDSVLEAAEDTPFFQLVRMMTFAGFFGLSKYGGYRDGVGWKLVGMDPAQHAHLPPFGYYDARYAEENAEDNADA